MRRDARNENNNQLDNKIKSAQNNINKFKSLLVYINLSLFFFFF